MIAHKMTFWKLALLSLGLCAHVGAFAQIGVVSDEGWQDVDSFLSEPDNQDSYNSQALSPGDIITVNIKKVSELSQNYTLDENGEIDFSLIGRVSAQGVGPDELAATLAALYEKDYLVNPIVTVSVFAKRSSVQVPAEPLTQPFAVLIDTSPVQIFPEAPSIATPKAQGYSLDLATGNEPLFSQAEPISPSEALPIYTDINPPNVSNFDAQAVEYADPIEYVEPVEYVEPIDNTLLGEIYTPSAYSAIEETQWSIEGSSVDYIHFLSGGDIAGALSCNNFFARYNTGQSYMNIHSLTMTNLACADQSKPQEFSDSLKQADSYVLSQGNLFILDDQSNVIFTLLPK